MTLLVWPVAEHAEQQREVLRAAAEDAGHPEIHGHRLREEGPP